MSSYRRVGALALSVVPALACVAAVPEPSASDGVSSRTDAQDDQAPPAPAPVPDNRCRGRALVVDVRPVAADERPRGVPSEAREHDLHSLVLEIETSRAVKPGIANLCVPGRRVEAFGTRRDRDEILDRVIPVELELLGDSEHRLWWLHAPQLSEEGP